MRGAVIVLGKGKYATIVTLTIQRLIQHAMRAIATAATATAHPQLLTQLIHRSHASFGRLFDLTIGHAITNAHIHKESSLQRHSWRPRTALAQHIIENRLYWQAYTGYFSPLRVGTKKPEKD
jgi:hypothetical protein